MGKKKGIRGKEKTTAFKTGGNFVLTTPLLNPIQVKNRVCFQSRSYKKTLLEQWSAVQSILSEYE